MCSRFSGDRFALYEYIFKEIGYRLPFTSFQIVAFANLQVALSQLHPNAFAFMRAFEIVCDFLGIRATISLFFRCFEIQR